MKFNQYLIERNYPMCRSCKNYTAITDKRAKGNCSLYPDKLIGPNTEICVKGYKKVLKEEYITTTSANVYGEGPREIFENPSKKELQEVANEYNQSVRFIINFTTKKLYVFNADLIHQEAATALYDMKLIPSTRIYTEKFTNTCFAGVGRVSQGKIEYTRTYEGEDMGTFRYSEWLSKGDDKWLNTWFVTPFIKTALVNITWASHIGQKKKKPKHHKFADRARFKRKSEIKEEYETTLRMGDVPYTVYKNPTISDFKELAKEIRLGGDKDLSIRAFVDLQHNNIYVWDANRAIHYRVMHELVKLTNISNNAIQLMSVIKNNKIDINKVDAPWTVDEPWLKEYFT